MLVRWQREKVGGTNLLKRSYDIYFMKHSDFKEYLSFLTKLIKDF